MGNLALYLGVGLLGGAVGLQLKFPGSVIIGSTLAVLMVKILLKSPWSPHQHINVGIQIMLGIFIGTRYSPELGRMLLKVIFPVIFSTFVVVAAGLIVAIILVKLHILDIPTAYLSTSPGAFSALVTLSLDSNADPSIVAAFHFFRVVFIFITAPIIFNVMQLVIKE